MVKFTSTKASGFVRRLGGRFEFIMANELKSIQIWNSGVFCSNAHLVYKQNVKARW